MHRRWEIAKYRLIDCVRLNAYQTPGIIQDAYVMNVR